MSGNDSLNNNTGIYELMQTIRDKDTSKNDMNEMGRFMRDMLMDKYVSNIQRAVSTHHQTAKENPSKEVRLLSSLKPFCNDSTQKSIDKMIDGFVMLETYKGLSGELSAASVALTDKTEGLDNSGRETAVAVTIDDEPVQAAAVNDESIHEDGIYDVDKACVIRKKYGNSNGNMVGMLMAVFAMMKKS